MDEHPWQLYALVGVGSLVVTLITVPIFRWLARKLDIVDRPSEARKVHSRVIPYLGGVPFYICFILTVLTLHFFFPAHSKAIFLPMSVVGTLIVIMGLYDDIRDMSSLKKLVVEMALILILYFWGYKTVLISSPLGGSLELGWLAIIITPLWIVGVINAINFCDGLDGLAGGLVFICAGAIFCIAWRNGQTTSCLLMAYLMGTTLGFLWYNFHPASIFMGDAGALFLGFILGSSTLVEEQKGVAVIALSVPMIVLAVPILDTVLSFYRRLQRARKGEFFEPDRNHLHHRLLDLGLTQKEVVLGMYYISICAGLMAFLLSVVPETYRFLIIVLAGLAILMGVVVLRFIESFAMRIEMRDEE